MESEKSESWSPGKREWLVTTSIALVGPISLAMSIYMGFFHHPPEPPITVQSDRAKFSALSYSEQLDRCAPYIKGHLQEWFTKWRNDLTEFDSKQGATATVPSTYSPLDELNAAPQDIVNSIVSIANYAEKGASASVGANLLTCIYSSGWQDIADRAGLYGFFTTVVGSGNSQPLQMPVVTRSSPIYYNGSYNGYSANARPNMVIETTQVNGRGKPDVSQDGFTMVDGRTEGVKMWVSFTHVLPDDKYWVQSLESFQGG
jgi:hypothetical protein